VNPIDPREPSVSNARPDGDATRVRFASLSLAILALAALAAAPARAAEPEGTLTAPARRADSDPPEAPAAPAPERISFDALCAEVERTSPLMEAARAGRGIFEAKLAQARAARFPTFKLEAGFAPSPAINGDENATFGVSIDLSQWGYVYRVSVTMVQPLFTFGKLRALRRAADHGIDVGNAQTEAARWELRYRVAQTWYGALLAREIGAIAADGKKWLDKAEARMERLRDEDSVEYDQMEHLRLKTRAAEFYELESKNHEIETASREGMRLLLGRSADTVVEPDVDGLEPLEVTLLPVERYVAQALGFSPGVRSARAEAKALDALADATWDDLWPEIAFIADARITDSNVLGDNVEILGTETVGVSAGFLFALRWRLDVPQKLADVREARAKASLAKSKVDIARAKLELDVRQTYQKLSDKKRLIEVYAESRKAAQGWLTATWDLYDGGFGSFRDVMDALVQFYTKKLGYLQAVHEHDILVFELSRAVGADIVEMGRPKDPPPGLAPPAE
jgi:multidrug efflux system outer membrane protein